jgi:FMN phosphatase YigB (HAD superfamily)
VDSFISSCFVHIRKPDADIFRLAPNIHRVSRKPGCVSTKLAPP